MCNCTVNKKIKIIINYFFIVFVCISSLNASILPKVESNCLWVKAESILDTSSVDSIVNFSNKNNINKLFFQVRSRGDALYNSSLVPKHENLDSLFDPLEYVINKTKNTNIEIHAWFNTYILWSSKYKPKDLNHFYYKCDDCFEVDLNGKSDKSIELDQFHSSNWEGIYLSPMHPDVNNHLFNVLNELVYTYDIDGIHLDYIRYQDMFYGYNEYGLIEFEDIYSINPIDLKRGIISERYGYNQNYVDSIKYEWQKFKINKINEFVRSIKYLILNNSLDIELSAAVKPDLLESKYRWYQDWSSWIDEDLVDFCVIMNYNADLNKYNSINTIISNQIKNKNKINIGLSAFNQSSNSISNKIIISRLDGYNNFSLFPYSIEKDTTNWYDGIYESMNFYIK